MNNLSKTVLLPRSLPHRNNDKYAIFFINLRSINI